MKEEPFRKAKSADGKLTLGVFEEDDYYVGFEGQAWHTHGPLLVPRYGSDPRSAALGFFEAVVGDREVISLRKRPGRDEEIYVSDDPDGGTKYMEPGELLELRLWSGRKIARHVRPA